MTYEVLETLNPKVGEESHHEGVLEEGDVLEVAGQADTGLNSRLLMFSILAGGEPSSLLCS